MNQTICRWQARWASVLALVALGATAASAQPRAEVAPSLALPYRSVFDGYQRFNEQPLASWSQSNATVEKIGGWRVYAKEARQPDTSDSAKKPAAPNPKPGGHDAHGGKP